MTMTPDPATIEAVARAIPAGMTAWHGQQHRAPIDWDGGPVLFRDDQLFGAPVGSIWKLGWDHHYGSGDVIAYTRTALRQQEAENAGK